MLTRDLFAVSNLFACFNSEWKNTEDTKTSVPLEENWFDEFFGVAESDAH